MTLFTAFKLVFLAGSMVSGGRRLLRSRDTGGATAGASRPSGWSIARQGAAEAATINSGRPKILMRTASQLGTAARLRRTSPALATATVGFSLWRALIGFMKR